MSETKTNNLFGESTCPHCNSYQTFVPLVTEDGKKVVRTMEVTTSDRVNRNRLYIGRFHPVSCYLKICLECGFTGLFNMSIVDKGKDG